MLVYLHTSYAWGCAAVAELSSWGRWTIPPGRVRSKGSCNSQGTKCASSCVAFREPRVFAIWLLNWKTERKTKMSWPLTCNKRRYIFKDALYQWEEAWQRWLCSTCTKSYAWTKLWPDPWLGMTRWLHHLPHHPGEWRRCTYFLQMITWMINMPGYLSQILDGFPVHHN